jgi:hypothetical protein
MTRELENQLKQMFAELDENLPVADFTSEVMSGLLRPRRRERLLWSPAILAALAFLWFSFPVLEAGFRIVAGFPRTLFAVGSDSLAALSQSPLVYVYGMALGGYVFLWMVRRLQIRLM